MLKPPDWRPPTLTTPRLTLRALTEADAAPLFEHCKNPNVTRFTLWDAHKTPDDTLNFIRDYAFVRYREGLADPYAITLTPDPNPIGVCGCFWASQPNRTAEIGYWLAEPFWGKGIAAEACGPLIDLAFRDFEAERLQARVIAGNTASSRVLEKLGFHHDGTLRSSLLRRGVFEDVLFWSLLRSEWTGPAGTSPG